MTGIAAAEATTGGPAWGREDQPDAAVDRLLDAAGAAFADHGIVATGMDDVARAAGCSRGTVYRYFASRDGLRRAYVAREARRIGAGTARRVALVDDPEERLVASICAALEAVRSDPQLRAWFVAEAVGTTARIAGGSDVIRDLARAFIDRTFDDAAAAGSLRPGLDREEAAAWVVRILLSLLADPADDDAHLVRRFLSPALFRH